MPKNFDYAVEKSNGSHSRMPSRNGTNSDNDDHSSTCSTLNRKNLRPPAYAFILPNLEQFPDDFRRFLERDMIEIPTLKRLEASGHLNWWCVQNASQRLWPLVTTGDGNCLLHAASLGIWGVHDRQLNLRQLLHEVLTMGERRHAFYRRWRWHESKSNLQSELVLSEEEWKKEWDTVLEMAAPTPRVMNTEGKGNSSSSEQIYESLECVHVFALAQVLKRPIIVVADTVLRNANGEELAPIPFGGIYLPLEIPAQQCHRSPLVLCYDSSHFSALVAMRQTSSNYLQAIPITDRNRNLLPVHFAVDPGSDFTWWKDAEDQRIAVELDAEQTDDYRLELIGRYMDIVKMDLRRGSVKKTLPVANGSEFTPSVPIKLLTLASGGNNENVRNNNGHASRILSEIRQHFRWLSRRSKRKHARPVFSAAELRQSNCVLTVLLHNYAHQYMDSMVNNYILGARERFERCKAVPSAMAPKNRMSRSFSSSSVLLTCLNTHCTKTASPSTNFLCSMCFEDQKREMVSIGSSSTADSPNSMVSLQKMNGVGDCITSSPSSRTDSNCSKSSTMPALSNIHNGNYINGNNNSYYNHPTMSSSARPSQTHDSIESSIRFVDEPIIRHRRKSFREAVDRPIDRLPSSPIRNHNNSHSSYFYEDMDPNEAVLVNGLMQSSLNDYDPYYAQYRDHNSSYSPRDHLPYYASHSLPRVALSPINSPLYGNSRSGNSNASSPTTPLAPMTPLTPIDNVTCVKTCAATNGIGNKVSSNGITFYYAAPS